MRPTLTLVFLAASVETEKSGHLYEKSTILHYAHSRVLARQEWDVSIVECGVFRSTQSVEGSGRDCHQDWSWALGLVEGWESRGNLEIPPGAEEIPSN